MMIAGGIIGGAKPATVVFTDDAADPDVDDAYSFTVDIGTAHPSRRVIFAVGTFTGLGTTVSGIRFNGSSVTPIITQAQLRLCIVDAPTGATANIGVTYSGVDANGTAVMVWAAYDLKSSTPVDTAQNTLSTGTATADLSVNTKSGGVVVGATWGGANGTNQTWTGLTEDFENSSSIDNFCRSAASANVDHGESPRTITVTSNNTSSVRRAIVASFR